MGWTFPWASSAGSDFNYDFRVTHSLAEWQSGKVEYNFGVMDVGTGTGAENPALAEVAAGVGVDYRTYRQQGPGISTFVLEDGVVHHTYSAYGRGVDGIWGMYQWLDRAPLGRNENGFWWHRHDEYDGVRA